MSPTTDAGLRPPACWRSRCRPKQALTLTHPLTHPLTHSLTHSLIQYLLAHPTRSRVHTLTVTYTHTPPATGKGGVPLEQLFGFEKVYLKPGQSVTLSFGMTARDLTLVDGQGVRRAVEGEWRVRIGVGEDRLEQSFCV